MGHDVADDPGEGDRPVHQVVLVGPVGVALAVGVVLEHQQALARRQDPGGGRHRPGQDQLARLVVADGVEGVGALGRGVLGVGVVDVVAGAVGEHGVDQVGLHLRRHRALPGEAPGVPARGLVLEVPFDLAAQLGHVGVDQRRRGRDGVRIGGAADDDPVLGLHAEHLDDGHGPTLSPWRLSRETTRSDATAARPRQSDHRRPPRDGPGPCRLGRLHSDRGHTRCGPAVAGLEVLAGRHPLDRPAAGRLVALGHDRADVDDPLALLARRSWPSRRGWWCWAGPRAPCTPA